MSTSVDALYSLGIPHNKFALTMPDGTYYPDFITRVDRRPVEFLEHYNRVREKDWEDCSFLDLGCSEGSTTLGLSQMGSTVYGVEGRADGVDRANVLKSIVGFENTHFRVDNVNEDSAFSEVDGIFNAGILYHLDKPIEFLVRCAENARDFVYVDTGHAPANAEEQERSKFRQNYGERYTLEYKGLKLDMQDFAEPGDPNEITADGTRRGPRSGIGNTNSVWITHASLIELMDKLGFGYHETIKYVPIIPRLRTCFFRKEPRELTSVTFTQPLPEGVKKGRAVRNTMERDIAFLRRTDKPIHVIGRDPVLGKICEKLRENGIHTTTVHNFPGEHGDRIRLKTLRQSMEGLNGVVVVAAPEPLLIMQALVRMDQFDLALTSLGLFFSAKVERERASAE